MKIFHRTISILLPFLFIFSTAHAKPTTIILWHALAGHLSDELSYMVDGFNQSQKDYEVKTIYKGDYVETLTSYAAAYRAHKAPDLIQVMEVGTATMVAPKGIVKPVADLLREQHKPSREQDFIPAVRQFYSQNEVLMAFPLSNSIPVLYYNADALAKIGYQAKNFPTTWQGLEVLAKQLTAKGYHCVYTSAHPAWVLVESFIALHGLPDYDPLTKRAIYNTKPLITHFERLKRWQSEGYFRYGGRSDNAASLFTSGMCPLYSQSSGAYISLKNIAPFKVGVAELPLDTDVSKERYANVIGGAALWVSAGTGAVKEKGIASFLDYIAEPKVQQRWHEQSGYLPLGLRGAYASIAKTSKQPVLQLAKADLLQAKPHPISLSNKVPQHQIRSQNERALEYLFSDLKSADEALKDAVNKANHLIKRYEQNCLQRP